MNPIDWLLFSITVSRRLTNAYYIIMLIISLMAIFFAYKMRYKRFSLYLWLISGVICLFWESYLFLTGARNYNFVPALELLYHALTEAGPGLIIMILFAHQIRLIDISEYSDEDIKIEKFEKKMISIRHNRSTKYKTTQAELEEAEE